MSCSRRVLECSSNLSGLHLEYPSSFAFGCYKNVKGLILADWLLDVKEPEWLTKLPEVGVSIEGFSGGLWIVNSTVAMAMPWL